MGKKIKGKDASSLAAPDMMSVARKYGMLTKRGGRIKTWKRRVFVLVGNRILYYKTPTDVVPLGAIEIGANVCGRADDLVKKKNSIFIKTQERTYYAFASESAEADSWVEAIRDCVKDGASEHVRFSSLQGKAYKKAKSRNEWKPRYFALHNNVLYYFRDKFDLRPKGSIITFKVQLEDVKDECNRSNTIKLIVSTRTYYIAFDSADECELWEATLQQLDYTVGSSNPQNGANGANGSKEAEANVEANTSANLKRSNSASNATISSVKYIPGETIMTGYMTKQGGSHKSWKRRFFIMTKTHLFYFGQEGDTEPKGSIDLNGRVVTRADNDIEFKHSILIETPSRKWYMYCDSEAEAERWCNKLKEIAQKTTKEILSEYTQAGWLTKRGGSVKTWKRRYCVLKGSILFYYKAKTDAVAKGNVNLSGVYIEKLTAKDADEETGKQHVFKMVTRTRTWYMYAETKEEFETWSLTLKAAALQMSGNTHMVDCTGARGKYTSINDAIQAAQPTDRIVVNPGVYLESVVVDKPLIIDGVGDVVIESKDQPPVVFDTSTAKMQNFILRHLDQEDVNCVDLINGNVVLEHCELSSEGGNCINCIGYTTLTLLNSRLTKSKQYGINLQDKSTGIIEENEICYNEWDGILVMGSACGILRKNKVHHNQYNGVCISCTGKCVLEHCEIFENEWDGVNVSNMQAIPTLYNNKVYRNVGYGIYFTDHCKPTSVDNEIYGNGKDAIRSNVITKK